MANPYHYPAGHEKGGQFASKEEVHNAFITLKEQAIQANNYDAFATLSQEYEDQFGRNPKAFGEAQPPLNELHAKARGTHLYQELVETAIMLNKPIRVVARNWMRGEVSHYDRYKKGLESGTIEGATREEFDTAMEYIHALVGYVPK